MFSDRTALDLTPNPMARRLAELRGAGVSILDLTESNPTRCGLRYPKDLLSRLAQEESLRYEPDPRGLLAAREAVASIYAEKGVQIHPDQILLTASTSEAYASLFRLLGDPGDQILVPRPSYPLFEHLAALNDLTPVFYSLRYGASSSPSHAPGGASGGASSSPSHDRWRIDFQSALHGITPKTRAIVAVHPNNPTGSSVTREERSELFQICRQRRLCLIADEVFADSCEEQQKDIPPTLSGSPDLVTFSLGGLSKFLGLPQMKLAWIAATGPAKPLGKALERLEWMADTYLSVGTPVQRALPAWLPCALDIQSQIRERLRRNRQFLSKKFHGPDGSLLAADGGWTAVLKVPSIGDEEDFVLELLEHSRLLVYPGYFFDFEESGVLVISLLPAPEPFEDGVARLAKALEERRQLP